MKQYYFISGLPRSGSTLLSAILSQNPEFYSDISGPVESLVVQTIKTLSDCESVFTISDDQRKNTIRGIFDGYYKHLEQNCIFDTSRAWTKKTSFLKDIFPSTKILCTVRKITDILNSFELIFSKNQIYHNILVPDSHNESIFSRCDFLMDKNNGIVSKSWTNLFEGYLLNPEMILIIEYEELCKYPEKTFQKIYDFLEKPYFKHDFENVVYSNENYDIYCNLKNLHTVRKKVEFSSPRIIIPNEIISKYDRMNMEFWRDDVLKIKSNKSYFSY